MSAPFLPGNRGGDGPTSRLILFDIDGTLVEGGPAKDAFHDALLSVFGTAGPVESVEFSGKTDPQIARELLRHEGLEDPEIDQGLPELWRAYLAELEQRLPLTPMQPLPGVRVLLEGLLDSSVGVGLVTGNIRGGARLKLGSAGFAGCFSVGSFGSDSEERDDLPRIAMERARRFWKAMLPPESVVVVGDTPRDVASGRRNGTRTLAVATGRFPASALERAGAHTVLEDLSSTDEVLGILLGPSPG